MANELYRTGQDKCNVLRLFAASLLYSASLEEGAVGLCRETASPIKHDALGCRSSRLEVLGRKSLIQDIFDKWSKCLKIRSSSNKTASIISDFIVTRSVESWRVRVDDVFSKSVSIAGCRWLILALSLWLLRSNKMSPTPTTFPLYTKSWQQHGHDKWPCCCQAFAVALEHAKDYDTFQYREGGGINFMFGRILASSQKHNISSQLKPWFLLPCQLLSCTIIMNLSCWGLFRCSTRKFATYPTHGQVNKPALCYAIRKIPPAFSKSLILWPYSKY